jgi:hypothetical protein
MAINNSILDNLKRTVEQLQSSVNKSIKESINKNKRSVRKLQTQDQMFKGLTNKGLDIKPAYAESTIKIKRKKGQILGRVTLRDTGDFYAGIEIIAGNNAVIIIAGAAPSYGIYVIDKYDDVLGLTNENWSVFISRFTIPTIKKNFDDIIAKS